MKEVPTYTATIWVGLRDAHYGLDHQPGEAESVCRAYCEEAWA